MNYIEILIKELDKLKAELDTDWHDMADSPMAMEAMGNLVDAHKHIKKATMFVQMAKARVTPPQPTMTRSIGVVGGATAMPNTRGTFVMDDAFMSTDSDTSRWTLGSPATSDGNTTGYTFPTQQPEQPTQTENRPPDQSEWVQPTSRPRRRRQLQDDSTDSVH